MPRWLSAVLLLTIFFLPLHFHVSAAISAQITKECACMQGTRTPADVGDAEPACFHPTVQIAVAPMAPDQFACQSVERPSSRAPPY